MKPTITARVKDLIINARVEDLTIMARVKDWVTNDRACRRCTHEKSDAEHAGDALTGKVMQSMQEMHSREGDAGDVSVTKVLQRFKRCVHVDGDHH